MRRTVLLCMAVVAGAFVLAIPGTALAGGGCHEGASHEDATGKDEHTVVMVGACFSASINNVDPGTSVTFLNKDDLTHNVTGTGWGNYEDMQLGDTFSARFDEPGIYPFACSYHPGMTGAIVVGSGMGAGNGFAVTSLPELPGPPAASEAATPVAASSSIDGVWLALVGLGGLAVGAAAGFSVRSARLRSEKRVVTTA